MPTYRIINETLSKLVIRLPSSKFQVLLCISVRADEQSHKGSSYTTFSSTTLFSGSKSLKNFGKNTCYLRELHSQLRVGYKVNMMKDLLSLCDSERRFRGFGDTNSAFDSCKKSH